VKILVFLVGIKVPRLIIGEKTPPTVSIPSDNGVASIITIPSVSFPSSPQMIPP